MADSGVQQYKTAYPSFVQYVINPSQKMVRVFSRLSGETVGLLDLWHL